MGPSLKFCWQKQTPAGYVYNFLKPFLIFVNCTYVYIINISWTRSTVLFKGCGSNAVKIHVYYTQQGSIRNQTLKAFNRFYYKNKQNGSKTSSQYLSSLDPMHIVLIFVNLNLTKIYQHTCTVAKIITINSSPKSNILIFWKLKSSL